MATKEATVYIVDIGSTMGERSHGRTQSNLDWALEYVWDRVSATITLGRKTALAGVIALRTDATDNPLEEEEDYHHISILMQLDQPLMPDVRRLRSALVVSNSATGDAISALVLAIQMISDKCRKLQYARRIVLVTDARSAMDVDGVPGIKDKIKEDHIDLTVLGVDFDDADYGFKEENKDPIKEENETILKSLCEDVDGNFGTLVQAIDEMQIPRLKSTRLTATYRGLMTLGHAEYNDDMTIDIERYPKVMRASAPSASQFALKSGVPEATQSTQTLSNNGEFEDGGDGLSTIRNARTYQVDDEDAPGGKKDITREELSKGYEYGRTAVHISESDQNVTNFETKQGFDIIGFVDQRQYCRWLDMSRTSLIVAQKHNGKASMALSSFIRALYELDSYAVARFVAKDNAKPQILLLTPNIEPDFECLYDVELPFAEDVRRYKFPPLDRVLTVSGNELRSHRNLPSDDLLDAVSDYVDSMDLSTFAKDDESGESEFAPIDETFNPMIHRLKQVIQHRAVYPEAEIPPPQEICTRYSQPPGDLVSQAKSALDRIVKLGNVKKVPPKARGKRYGRKEAPKPLSDLDVAALLSSDPQRKSKRIDPKNAIPEFRQMLENAEKIEELHDACKQLKFIVFDWVKHSVGSVRYGQAIEAIRVMREEMVEMEEPGPFNEFAQELKTKVRGGELSGDRKDFLWQWRQVGGGKLRPIHKKESEGSEWTEADAIAFWTSK